MVIPLELNNCTKIKEYLFLREIDHLEWSKVLQIEAHLAGCARCQDQEDRLNVLLKSIKDFVNPDIKLPAEILHKTTNYFKSCARQRRATGGVHHSAKGSYNDRNGLSDEKLIRESLDKMNNAQRSTILLRFSENYSIERISEIMQCDPEIVRHRLFWSLHQMLKMKKTRKPQD